jgi:hypothetical protein
VCSKGLSDLAFYSITLDRRPAGLERDAETEVSKLVGHTKKNALLKAKNLAVVEKAPVLPRKVESSFERE